MRLLNATHDELAHALENYLNTDSFYKSVYDYTKQRFEAATHLPAHNWSHAYRDTLNAIVIGEAEGADMKVVLPAVTMHDIGFLYGSTGKTHGAIGADHVAEYLKEGNIEYSSELVAKIADCIRTHKGSMHNERPESLEARVVADADMLEKFGPFGVYQNIRTFTEFNYPLEKILERGTEIFKLTLETPTGQRLAESGRQFVAGFYKELSEANEPYAEKQ
jgi:hypothetical protein